MKMKRVLLKAKLYRDLDHYDYWIAWSANIGWVRFPARPHGWADRKPVVALDTLHLCEVSLAQAFNTDLIEAFRTNLFPLQLGTGAAPRINAPLQPGIG